ncbi:hypothetical protein TNIN_384231 [Trichonephila inaurata madagascariensis]|uniref:Uncharacterized protein n=1 Tax=Trichonephila inaurata madagascariensis TaxID=2747483 RepID=A0A8X6J3I7_9ARAC|nr:hypothetical protein TNIN_384231 [Trichonephila inaurata madagascariensis]
MKNCLPTLKTRKSASEKCRLEEKLPPSELVDQHNAPSTSKEACQDQDDTRRRSDRLAKKIDDTMHSDGLISFKLCNCNSKRKKVEYAVNFICRIMD